MQVSAQGMHFIDVQTDSDNLALSEYAYFIKGDNQPLELADIKSSAPVLSWQFSQGKSPNFGINSHKHWFLVNLSNGSDQSIDKLLSLNSFMPRSVSVYQQLENAEITVIGENMGFDDRFNNRPIADNAILFRIQIPAHAQLKIYVHYLGLSNSSFELYLHDESAFNQRNMSKSLGYGFSYGFYTLALIACLFLYALSRDKSFGFFALLIFSILLTQTTQYGHAYQLLPESGYLIPWLWYLASGLFITSLSSFSLSFTRIKKVMPRFHKAIAVGMWVVTLPLTAAWIFDLDLLANIFFSLFIPLTFSLFIAGVCSYKQGNYPVLYFCYGIAFLCSSITLEVLRFVGVFEAQGIVILMILAGVMLMVCFFSVGLGIKYYYLSKNSAQKLINKERQLMQAEKAELDVERSNQFLATMSHEIRTPINGVLGMAEILSLSGLNAQQQYYNNLVLNSGKTLLCIINDILDFSKLQSDKLNVEHISFNLDELLTNTLGLYNPQAIKKQIKLQGNLHADVPVNCKGDPYRLQQVINNLIANAIKFTDEGAVEFILSGRELSEDRFELQLDIKDSGIGIAEKQINALFNAFEQADTSTSRQYGGTGLGLTISKRLINLMQGTINVSSELGKGSCFTVMLPLSIDLHNEQQRQKNFMPIKGASLILIDSSSYYQSRVKKLLEYWGAKVVIVNNVADACILMAKESIIFDIAVLGLFNRREADNHALNILLNHKLPIISMTGTLPNLELDGAAQKKLHVLSEMPTSSEFLKAVVHCMTGSKNHTNTAMPEKKKYSESLRLLVAEDNMVNQQVILAMAKKLGLSVTLAENGLEALAVYRSESSSFAGILMDCEMPEMDGYTAASEIRQFEKSQKISAIPIVALTAHVLPEHHQRCLDSGINDMLSKPLSLAELSDAIDKWFVVAEKESVNEAEWV
ncbi:MAG: response regulator [Pseudomonadales bacterium]|nr:response regulator [Pseudomonadales bacterium]